MVKIHPELFRRGCFDVQWNVALGTFTTIADGNDSQK